MTKTAHPNGKTLRHRVSKRIRGSKTERALFHSAMLDRDSLKVKEDFGRLPETYVIFITGKDYFGEGEAVYPIDRVNLVKGECFDDRAHIVYVNSEYENDDAIGKLLHDLRCSDPNEMYYDIIRKDTAYLKTNDKKMKEMSQVVEELINEGKSSGRTESIKEETENKLKQILV